MDKQTTDKIEASITPQWKKTRDIHKEIQAIEADINKSLLMAIRVSRHVKEQEQHANFLRATIMVLVVALAWAVFV